MGNFDEWLRHIKALSCVYTQLKDGWGKDEYIYIYSINLGSGDKQRSIICQCIYFISVFNS